MDLAKNFIEAVKHNDVETLKKHLDEDISLLYARSPEQISAFMTAIYHGHKHIADLLLRRGLTLDIFEAAAHGDVERVAELLKEQPALLNGYSADGWTALHLAAYFGNMKVVELLLALEADVGSYSRNPMQVTALHSSLSNMQWDIARTLIKHGADIHAKTSGTLLMPLHYAAANGSLSITELLVTLGADMYARTSEGKTPLQLAVEKGRADVAAFLQKQATQ